MLEDKINSYLELKESAWSLATYRSEKSRLNKVRNDLHLGPKKLREKLTTEGMKPYSIKTLYIRLADFEKHMGMKLGFGEYLRTHRNRFKHVYEFEEIGLSYEEVVQLIEKLEDPYKTLAMDMLNTGIRMCETYTVRGRRVTGKGGKQRKIFGTIKGTVPRSTFWRKLKAVGLKPHDLRKVCATRLAKKGASPADLCKVFGWTDIKTAYRYWQPLEDSKLETLMAESPEEPERADL